MTGISDISRNAKELGRRMVPKFILKLLQKVFPFIQKLPTEIVDILPGPSLLARPRSKRSIEIPDKKKSSKNHLWGILLPIRGSDDQNEATLCWKRLQNFADTLRATTSKLDRSCIRMFIGIDKDDIVYTPKKSRSRIESIFNTLGVTTYFHYFEPIYSGKICWIWNELACKAVEQASVEFIVLLGDDVELCTNGWKNEIESTFLSVSQTTGLPFGIACVAFRDENYAAFPTFPVLHCTHLHVFGELFPSEFINQHGDPYVFEIYRRWGASMFAKTSKLRNTIGGADASRYRKISSFCWRDTILSKAIQKLSMWLEHKKVQKAQQYHCLDVVVPSYRCDINLLQNFANLRVSIQPASITIVIVVDNPDLSPEHLAIIQSLQSHDPNHIVRIHKNEVNLGASESRNTGLSQSFGDYAILLDDDVIPEISLLDAYLGAIIRNPKAKILVGHTKLPSPQTLLQKGFIASEMSFFYDVCMRMPNPSWGVTANICVKSRTQNKVWFSACFPKTGGGEDVDFCLRLKRKEAWHERNSCIIAVPGAKVLHLFWNNITKQVSGWASGDTLLLEVHPELAFFAFPNWVEWMFVQTVLYLLLLMVHSLPLWLLLQSVLAVCIAELILSVIIVYQRTKFTESICNRLLQSVIGTWFLMVQDVTRLCVKLKRLQIYLIGVQFDWLDNQRGHVETVRISNFIKNMFVLSIMISLFYPSNLVKLISSIISILLLYFWCTSQHASVVSDIPLPFEGILQKIPDVQPFVILTWQRTGSNLLCGILHNHQDITMHSEVFHARKIHTFHENKWSDSKDWNWTSKSRDEEPETFLKDLLLRTPSLLKRHNNSYDNDHKKNSIMTCSRSQAVGFKLFPEHIRRMGETGDHVFRKMMADPYIKKIILMRKNALEVFVSMKRASLTGKYLKDNYDHLQVHVDPPELQLFLRDYHKCFKCYDEMLKNQATYKITYEDLVNYRESSMKALLSFLNLDDGHIPKPIEATRKQSSKPMHTAIKNYSELKLCFKHSKFASMFNH
mmetsp:Transcript_7212/g.10150  ORF Transcript_7212/g.10150 Transcript_7212/m.10150 type:complete len:1017 (-) Transcript_7212:189-3239(-)